MYVQPAIPGKFDHFFHFFFYGDDFIFASLLKLKVNNFCLKYLIHDFVPTLSQQFMLIIILAYYKIILTDHCLKSYFPLPIILIVVML